MVSRRSEVVLGLLVPLVVIVCLMFLGLTGDQAEAYIAFLAAVPMFAALFTGVAFCGVVALAAVAAAVVTSVVTFGQSFTDAVPILIGVMLGAAVAVVASQLKSGPMRQAGPVSSTVAAPTAAGDAATDRPRGAQAPPEIVWDPEWEFDELTGLPHGTGVVQTRGGMNDSAPRVVAFLRCDGLSKVNHDFGTAIGDEFLFAVSGRTRYALPPRDVVARWGEDDFLLIITGDAAAVRPTLDLLAAKVNDHPIRTASGLVPATVSIGAAAWSVGTLFDDAAARALLALDEARASGPANVVLDEQELETG